MADSNEAKQMRAIGWPVNILSHRLLMCHYHTSFFYQCLTAVYRVRCKL